MEVLEVLEKKEISPYTTIRVRKETRERLKQIGRKDESYDSILNRLIDEYLRKMEDGV